MNYRALRFRLRLIKEDSPVLQLLSLGSSGLGVEALLVVVLMLESLLALGLLVLCFGTR